MRDGTNLRYSREKQKLAWQTRVKKVGFEGSTSKIVKYWNREMRELEHSSWRRFRSAEGWVKCDSSLCDRNETESRRPAVSRERRKTDVRAWLSDYSWLERAYCEIVGNEYGTLSTPSPPLRMVRTAWIFFFFQNSWHLGSVFAQLKILIGIEKILFLIHAATRRHSKSQQEIFGFSNIPTRNFSSFFWGM